MLASITPLVQRGPGQSFGSTVTAYLLATTAAAAATGAVLGTAGAALPDALPRLTILAAVTLVAAGAEVAGRQPPSWRRQVNEDWLVVYRGWVTGAGFGLQLGTGVVTIVTSASTYCVLAAELLLGRPLAGLAVGAAFGAARALPLLGSGRVRSPQALRQLTVALSAYEGVARRLTTLSLMAVGLAAVAVATAGPGGWIGGPA